VNDGDLQVVVVMQNTGLPEAGDAVLTFPRSTWRIGRPTSVRSPPTPARARARRDLAVTGFLELRRRTEAGDTAALEEFYVAAAALTRTQLPAWRERWLYGAAGVADRTGREIDALAAGDHSYLRAATVSRAERPPQETLGMCGCLAPY
jgi:hypothetical protein